MELYYSTILTHAHIHIRNKIYEEKKKNAEEIYMNILQIRNASQDVEILKRFNRTDQLTPMVIM